MKIFLTTSLVLFLFSCNQKENSINSESTVESVKNNTLFKDYFDQLTKSEICDCADTALAMMKEVKEAGMDPSKMQAIQDKYKADIEKCEKLGEGKSDEEKKKMEAEMKACDSYKELETLIKRN
jgi:cell division protein FtsI/penicillin-binding protein 2